MRPVRTKVQISVRSVNRGASIARSLFRSLEPVESEMARKLGVSNFLAIATVVRGERPAGRLLISPQTADTVVQLVRDAGACCHRATFHCVEGADAVAGTHHRGSFVNSRPKNSQAVVYFGMKPEYAEAAEAAELTSDHMLSARLFGYPDCCAAAFERSANGEADKLPGTITGIGPYPRAMNPLSFYVYGTPNLLFHFPCSPHCAPSAHLVESRRAFLAALLGKPDLLKDLGEGIAVYGPDVGIGLITRYRRLSESAFEIHEVITRSRRTRSLFEGQSSREIRLIQAHRFRIGPDLYSGELTFAARFQ